MTSVLSKCKLFSGKVLIGVTGHRDIIVDDKLCQRIKAVLSEIKAKHKNVALLSFGAKGADQLAAKLAAPIQINTIAVQLLDYKADCNLQDFLPNQDWIDKHRDQPDFKICYAGDGSFEKRIEEVKRICNDETRAQAFAKLVQDLHAANSRFIAAHSNYILALWDGVDNGKTGGTSETVHIALHQKDFKGGHVPFAKDNQAVFTLRELANLKKTWLRPKGLIYHIVSARTENPFPLGRFPAGNQSSVPNASRYEAGISPFPIIPATGNRWQLSWIKVKSVYRDGLFLNYLLPAALVLVTVALGSFGFAELRHYEEWKTEINPGPEAIGNYNWNYKSDEYWPETNDIFNAVNLVTFNSSGDINPENVPLKLSIARWTGLLFVLNAFFIAYLLATSKNTRIRFKVFWWRFLGKRFHLVCGLNEKSYSLCKDLKSQGKCLLMIEGDPDPNKMAEAEKKGILVFKADTHSKAALSKIRAGNAKKVFLMDEDDVKNIRTLQELRQLKPAQVKSSNQDLPKTDYYIHLIDSRYKDFLCKTNPDTPAASFHVFNIYENTARRLLLKYPIHRFKPDESPETASVFVFGFGDMAEQLVLSCLRLGFYTMEKQLKITVFTSAHESKAAAFYKKYPSLWYSPEHNPVYEKPFARKVREDIFPHHLLTFKELPLSDAAYFSEETIYDAIVNKHLVSLYFCLPQSMQSAAYLYTILPKIQHLQGSASSASPLCDVQCFCHYNLYDKDEVKNVEHIVNSKIPNSAVVFFGSLTEACTADAITGRSDDLLPKLINVWYKHDKLTYKDGRRKDASRLAEERAEFWLQRSKEAGYIGTLKQEALARWKQLSITEKESNRYAADHLWIKVYLLGYTHHNLSELIKQTSGFQAFVKDFTAMSGSRLARQIEDLAKVEHRRWIAEKLLEGFLPAQDFDASLNADPAETIVRWNNKDLVPDKYKEFKSYYQEQKLHIDLLPFDELFVGRSGGNYFNEKIKDISLVEAIPYLIYSLQH